MAQTLAQAFQDCTLYSDDYLYRFVTLPPNRIIAAAGVIAEANTPFSALLLDKDEVTLMIEEEDFEQYKKRLNGFEVSDVRYRLITFDVVLESNLVGFMAVVSNALAEANISLMPFAAYSRDHILVGEADYNRAVDVLNNLKTSIK